MAVPKVAIVGRPNVGKSSLFNWLVGRRIAIVEPTAGVTRDRISALVSLGDRCVELVDTGGMGVEDVDQLTPLIERQIQAAIDEARVVLFVVDARSGLTPLDREVADRLRALGRGGHAAADAKPVILIANKCDTVGLETQLGEFFRLGWGEPLPVSAQQGRGKAALIDRLAQCLPPSDTSDAPPEPVMKLAIVGRRNVGKSTFINCLAQSERMIVSEVAGTTRDSVDVRFERDGQVFLAIDTAGVRHKGSIQNDIEFYSLARAERSIRRADVVLHFLDAPSRISKVDKRLADYVLKEFKPVIFVVNKWDLTGGQIPTSAFGDYVRAVFPMLDFVPMAFITAKTGKNVPAVLDLAQNLYQQAQTRVSTGDLNRVLRQALAEQAPPLRQNRRPKIFYATQVAVQPPTIVLFSNGPELFDATYLRYLEKVFRDRLPFTEVPIKLLVRDKRRAAESVADADEAEPTPVSLPRRQPSAGHPPQLWDDV
ncbi:MAG: ribosome biogenesis GTPase Der [Gemmataceae bacterium]|nr:ribosome biogenesis GTPase Der [Gemmataceae bacterium]